MSSGFHEFQAFEAPLDLGARLYANGRRYEAPVDGRWLLFAPDAPGPPVVVDGGVRSLLARFEGGATRGDILARSADAAKVLQTLAALEARGFLGTEPRRLPYPQPFIGTDPGPEVQVWIQVTNACNLDCPYCFVRRKDASALDSGALEGLCAALAAAVRRHGIRRLVLKFAGGEPTLRMDRVEAIRARLDLELGGLSVETESVLITNGTEVGPEVFRFLERPGSCIAVSVDGIGGAHDLTRSFKEGGGPSWEVIARNVEILMARGFRPTLLGTLGGATRHGLPSLVRWGLDRSLQVRLTVVADPAWPQGWTAYGQAMAEAFEALFEDLEAGPPLDDPLGSLTLDNLKFGRPALDLGCGFGRSYLVFRTDGTLVPCPMLLDRPGLPPGDDPLAAAREGAGLAGHWARRPGTCLACTWFPVCTGGCPVEAERAWGDPFARSPLCGFHRAVIPRYLQFLARQIVRRAACRSTPERREHEQKWQSPEQS